MISCKGSAPPAGWPGGSDREFVSLATRILELRPGEKPGDAAKGVAQSIDYSGGYDDYRASAALAAA